ncbi:MAG TPA: glycosyltransferase family 4 protein [Blastocatellia bacterium]|nr:glycosyltransferase family 4 protein [Blastocatellia bacterium]
MEQITSTSSQSELSTRPRVLIVSPHLTKTLGGITAMVREILASNLALEYEFHYVASQADEYSKFGKLLLATVALIQYVWDVIWLRPQLVFIHVGGNASLYRKLPFIAFGRLTRRRVLAHFHAGDFEPYFARQSRLGQWLILRGLGLSHRVIACSNELGRRLKEHLPEADVVVVPNGVETEMFATERRPKGEDQRHAPVRLLFAGAMGRLKGERDLVRAIERARVKAPNLRVMMLGHGSETVLDLCGETGVLRLLDYLGPVPMSRRAVFFKQADFFVLPTYAEGLPVSVIEAMAAGLPVITTPVGGTPELITQGVEGWMVEPGDVDALAEKIVLLASDEQMRLEMGERAQMKARHFDRSVVLARLDAVMRQTLPKNFESLAETAGPDAALSRRAAAVNSAGKE